MRAALFQGLGAAIFLVCAAPAGAVDPPAPVITNFLFSSSRQILQFPPYPAADAYDILRATNLSLPLTADSNFVYSRFVTSSSPGVTNYAYGWVNSNSVVPASYFRARVTPMNSNAALTALVLNRLAYGPTPDELARVAGIGPQAFIDEQLSPWNIPEDISSQNANMALFDPKFIASSNIVTSTSTSLNLSEFRAWHSLRAVGARRQLLEILLQWLENHFVTQYSKTLNYFDTYYNDTNLRIRLSAQTEYLENAKWREALLNPSCTFYDLLKISAESPAMIIYLDTVSSRGDGSNVANENYARELMELFTMGVDNGYDQNDITVQSRVWTGWRHEKVATNDAFNPFALALPGAKDTNVGVWAFNYKSNFHNNTTKTIFAGKSVPPRFGAPWTTRTYGTNSTPGLYQIVIPGRTGTNGIQEGYEFIQHIAALPFSEEYISIKLCRLFVHDNFPNPSNDPSNPSYATYNYAAGGLSPEAALVHSCMLAWETNSPRGQVWKVLQTIFNSDLFRSQSAAGQKVKTPLEYCVSAVRAFRSSTNGSFLPGSFTADCDGFCFSGTNTADLSPLKSAGGMLLFDRGDPDGYPESASPWISAGTLAERIRFVQSFCLANGQVGHSGWQGGGTNDAGSAVCDLVGLLRAQEAASTWTNAGAVADYFLRLLYPGEGKANLALYRASAIDFLNDGSADTVSNNVPFNSLSVSGASSSDYDKRVRGMAGMLLSFQRFQEQ